jgi:RNA polymerase sigma-70 factor (ECF subfamily)
MGNDSASRTSPTLLRDLQRDPTDQVAWGLFVQRYGRKIYSWCRHWHLRVADAEDVTQVVLGKLVVRLRTFVYDPAQSFRAWLKTLTHHAWQDLVASRKRHGEASGDSKTWQLLRHVEAGTDLVQRLEEAFDGELLEAAMARVRQRVAPHTWDAFRLTALEGLPGAAAAAQLHMKVATVFSARRNVEKMLREEVRCLERLTPE